MYYFSNGSSVITLISSFPYAVTLSSPKSRKHSATTNTSALAFLSA